LEMEQAGRRCEVEIEREDGIAKLNQGAGPAPEFLCGDGQQGEVLTPDETAPACRWRGPPVLSSSRPG
jgi:hypothetical protein